MQADTTRLGVPGQSAYGEKGSKYAKTKLSYKSSRRAVKLNAGPAEDLTNSVRTVDKPDSVSYYCHSVFAELPFPCTCSIFHTRSSCRQL